ncbi:hypothetical protein KL86DES1_20679 [uncultured Desulfovibrio sp.]|uniref:Uncharacterized protein n=1 Tax=uncultured Desulfovibrio sp. TaxID=167968 RepID=A0A212L4R6_9BACT|nr:hypothetical protein KL86DES1_20679 [uncultured Desulfovibrio sp.]VZH33581.1 conserved protein of unknown function [Desulfovibrio sp. 86]
MVARHLSERTAVAIHSDAVLPRKSVPANGSGKSAGAGNGYRENRYSQCENARVRQAKACLLTFRGKDFQKNPCRAVNSFHS